MWPLLFILSLPQFPHLSVQFSHSVMSNSLQLHEPQHTRSPCPLPTPRVHPNPCLLSRWCHPTTSSSVVPFSSCPQSFPAWGSFQMSQLFRSGGQSIGVSASASVLPFLICSKIKIIKSTSQNCCKIEMSSYMSKCPSQWPAHSKHNINVFCHYCIVLLLLLC